MSLATCAVCGSKGEILEVESEKLMLLHDLGLHQHLQKCRSCGQTVCLLCVHEAGRDDPELAAMCGHAVEVLICPLCGCEWRPGARTINIGGNLPAMGRVEGSRSGGGQGVHAPPSGGGDYAARLMASLEGRPELQRACSRALERARDGQAALGRQDWRGSVAAGEEARKTLTKVPGSRAVLGIVQADLAAAHCNLGSLPTAARLAEEAIAGVAGALGLEFTAGSAHMTLGICHYRAGRPQAGREAFEQARRIYRELRGGEDFVRLANANEEAARRATAPTANRGTKLKRWLTKWL